MSVKIFKNTNFKKRDYSCTNLVYAVSEIAPNQEWIETDEFKGLDETDIEWMTGTKKLYRQNGVTYFGYL